MSKILNAITEQLAIERKLAAISGDDDLSWDNEVELKSAEQEVMENVDRAVFAYKAKQQELEFVKTQTKALLDSKKKQLENFKNFLHQTCDTANALDVDLTTPLTSVKLQTKKSSRVIITNFDEVLTQYPEASKIETKENVRTISLDKTYLKKLHQDSNGLVFGFKIEQSETEFVSVRIRASKAKE